MVLKNQKNKRCPRSRRSRKRAFFVFKKTYYNVVSRVATNLRRYPPSVLLNSTYFQRFLNILSRDGAHLATRRKTLHLLTMLRICYHQLGIRQLIRGANLYRFPLVSRKIIRRRQTYEKLGVARIMRQRKVALNTFSKLFRQQTFPTAEKTFLGRGIRAVLNTSIFHPPTVYPLFERLWDVA
jgi:hypothetical protein